MIQGCKTLMLNELIMRTALSYSHFIFGQINFTAGIPLRRWDLLPSRRMGSDGAKCGIPEENFRKIIRRETVGIEKISCKSRAFSTGKRRCLRGLSVEAWKWFIKDTGTISSRSMVSSGGVKNLYLSLPDLFWQSEKYLPKRAVFMLSCKYITFLADHW